MSLHTEVQIDTGKYYSLNLALGLLICLIYVYVFSFQVFLDSWLLVLFSLHSAAIFMTFSIKLNGKGVSKNLSCKCNIRELLSTEEKLIWENRLRLQ